MGKENRVFERKEISLNIKVRESGDDYDIDFPLVDLGEGGIFIQSSILWEPGQLFDLTFKLPDSNRIIECKGEVARTEDKYFLDNFSKKDDPTPGMGIKFVEMSNEDKEFLRQFIKNNK